MPNKQIWATTIEIAIRDESESKSEQQKQTNYESNKNKDSSKRQTISWNTGTLLIKSPGSIIPGQFGEGIIPMKKHTLKHTAVYQQPTQGKTIMLACHNPC